MMGLYKLSNYHPQRRPIPLRVHSIFQGLLAYLILNPLQALKLQVRRLTASRRCTC